MKIKLCIYLLIMILLSSIAFGELMLNMTFDYQDGTYSSTFSEDLTGNYNGTVIEDYADGVRFTDGRQGRAAWLDGNSASPLPARWAVFSGGTTRKKS